MSPFYSVVVSWHSLWNWCPKCPLLLFTQNHFDKSTLHNNSNYFFVYSPILLYVPATCSHSLFHYSPSLHVLVICSHHLILLCIHLPTEIDIPTVQYCCCYCLSVSLLLLSCHHSLRSSCPSCLHSSLLLSTYPHQGIDVLSVQLHLLLTLTVLHTHQMCPFSPSIFYFDVLNVLQLLVTNTMTCVINMSNITVYSQSWWQVLFRFPYLILMVWTHFLFFIWCPKCPPLLFTQ